MHPIIVCHFTLSTHYEEHSNILRRSAEKYGLDYRIDCAWHWSLGAGAKKYVSKLNAAGRQALKFYCVVKLLVFPVPLSKEVSSTVSASS